MTSSEVSLGTYSTYNPLVVPKEMVYLLQSFDGRPIADVRAEIQEQHGMNFDQGLVERLLDFGVLKEADVERQPASA
jgi:hypothetical protein